MDGSPGWLGRKPFEPKANKSNGNAMHMHLKSVDQKENLQYLLCVLPPHIDHCNAGTGIDIPEHI